MARLVIHNRAGARQKTRFFKKVGYGTEPRLVIQTKKNAVRRAMSGSGHECKTKTQKYFLKKTLHNLSHTKRCSRKINN